MTAVAVIVVTIIVTALIFPPAYLVVDGGITALLLDEELAFLWPTGDADDTAASLLAELRHQTTGRPGSC